MRHGRPLFTLKAASAHKPQHFHISTVSLLGTARSCRVVEARARDRLCGASASRRPHARALGCLSDLSHLVSLERLHRGRACAERQSLWRAVQRLLGRVWLLRQLLLQRLPLLLPLHCLQGSRLLGHSATPGLLLTHTRQCCSIRRTRAREMVVESCRCLVA